MFALWLRNVEYGGAVRGYNKDIRTQWLPVFTFRHLAACSFCVHYLIITVIILNRCALLTHA